MKKEELKEKNFQAEAKLTDEQLNQCGASLTYDLTVNCQDTLGKAEGFVQLDYAQGKAQAVRTLR